MSESQPPEPPQKKAGAFPDAQWLCFFLIGFTGYLFAKSPTTTSAQLIFRLTLMLAGVVGLIVIWTRKKQK